MSPYDNVDEILRDLESTSLVGPVSPWDVSHPVSSVHISPPGALGRPTVTVSKAAQTANYENVNIQVNADRCEFGLNRLPSPPQYLFTTPTVRPQASSVEYYPCDEDEPCRKRHWLRVVGIVLGLISLDVLLFCNTGFSVIVFTVYVVVVAVHALFAWLF